MDIVEDQVLRKAQRGLLFGKPKFGIFVTALYKKNLNVDDPSVHSGILEAACDVIKYALKLEKAEGNGKEYIIHFLCRFSISQRLIKGRSSME